MYSKDDVPVFFIGMVTIEQAGISILLIVCDLSVTVSIELICTLVPGIGTYDHFLSSHNIDYANVANVVKCQVLSAGSYTQ